MNREIEYIISVTTSAILDDTGKWTYSGGLPQNPDECVIRQMTYSSEQATKGIYLVGSSMGFLGSVANMEGFVACPQTRIQLRHPLSQSVEFQLYLPSTPPNPASNNWEFDFVSITMDFIKYKK